jgi:hypothetical protein
MFISLAYSWILNAGAIHLFEKYLRILNYFRLNSLVGQGTNVKSMFSTIALLKLGSSPPLEISTLPESFLATYKKFVMKHDRVLKW